MSLLPRLRFRKLIKRLKKNNLLPKNLELTQVGPIYVAVAYDEEGFGLMHPTSTTGLDTDPYLAFLKALSEYFERKCVKDQGIPSSLGFAAMPRILTVDHMASRQTARHAYAEAFERFVWASWWDSPVYRHTVNELPLGNSQSADLFLNELRKHISIDKTLVVEPLTSPNQLSTLILIGYLNGGGLITGGAAGFSWDRERVLFRAFAEFFRHGIAAARHRQGQVPIGFYDERLAYFSTGKGDQQVRLRLEEAGSKCLELPKLSINSSIRHNHEDLFFVHRCLFENQPPFIGGSLDRMCL